MNNFQTVLASVNNLSPKNRDIEIRTIIEIKSKEIGSLKNSDLPFIKAKIKNLLKEVSALEKLISNKMGLEEFRNHLEYRHNEIYVPALNRSINKSYIKKGKLDNDRIESNIQYAYSIYLNK